MKAFLEGAHIGVSPGAEIERGCSAVGDDVGTGAAGDDVGVDADATPQVIPLFEAGDLRRPYAIGACWNGSERAPQSSLASNDIRVWKTRAGSKLEFDDADGATKITLTTKKKLRIVLDEAEQSITIKHFGGSTVRLNASGQVEGHATNTVEITAPAMNVHALTTTFDGIVTCKSLVANVAVSSPLYTQGAGNFW